MFLLPLLAAPKYPSIRVTHTHFTLSLSIEVNKSHLRSEEVIFLRMRQVKFDQKFNHPNEQKTRSTMSKK